MTSQNIPYIEAHNLSLKTLSGYQYRNVSLSARRGCVLAVQGEKGSGKTALLLTLAGRMKATEGTLRVGAWNLPKQRARALRQVGLSLFAGANDLQDNLRACDAVRMELELFGRPSRRAAAEAFLDEWDLLSAARVQVRHLTAQEHVQLGIALAFAGDPHAVVVDDVESQLTLMQSKGLMALLAQRARERNTAVVVGVVERMLAKGAHDCVHLERQQSHRSREGGSAPSEPATAFRGGDAVRARRTAGSAQGTNERAGE